MEDDKKITDAIAKLSMEISERYPEMSKYVNEMPVTNPDKEHPDINNKILKDYYDNLKSIMQKYADEHAPGGMPDKVSAEDEKL
jgi:hypothetical protein